MVLYVKSLITASRHVVTACNYDPFSVVLSPLFVCLKKNVQHGYYLALH